MNAPDIEFIRRYLPDAQRISPSEIDDADRAALPQEWLKIVSRAPEDRPHAAIAAWSRFEDVLPQLIGKLTSDLCSVDLLRHRNTYSLVYGIRYGERVIYYQSRDPRKRRPAASVSKLWPLLPAQIRDFYDFADGWHYLASRSMGLSPSSDIFCLASEVWGILDDIGPQPVDLENTLALFTNGKFGYVCIDLTIKDPTQSGLIWWNDRAPTLNQDFWAIVDAWTVIGLEA